MIKKFIPSIFYVMLWVYCDHPLNAQTLELLGGISNNHFFDYGSESGHYQSSYTDGIGYAIGLGYDFPMDSFWVRLTLLYESYSGNVEASDGGLGGGTLTKADINKDVIALTFFPVNINIKKRIWINAGFEASVLTQERLKGTTQYWTLGQPTIIKDLNEVYSSFSSSFQIGIRLRFAYTILLSPSVMLTPQYSFYYGLTNEFKEFPEITKSYRHYLLIGIGKKM